MDNRRLTRRQREPIVLTTVSFGYTTVPIGPDIYFVVYQIREFRSHRVIWYYIGWTDSSGTLRHDTGEETLWD